MPKRMTFFLGALLFVIYSTGQAGENNGRVFAVLMDERSEAIPDFDLIEQLERQLLYHHDFSVLRSDRFHGEPEPPLEGYSFDKVMSWGMENECRYVLYITIDLRRIVTTRQFSIPYVFNRYAVEGHIDGMFALLDIGRGKELGVWPLASRTPGPRQWQVNEDYKEDPDLFIPYPERLTFYDLMEEQAAKDILAVVKQYMRGH